MTRDKPGWGYSLLCCVAVLFGCHPSDDEAAAPKKPRLKPSQPVDPSAVFAEDDVYLQTFKLLQLTINKTRTRGAMKFEFTVLEKKSGKKSILKGEATASLDDDGDTDIDEEGTLIPARHFYYESGSCNFVIHTLSEKYYKPIRTRSEGCSAESPFTSVTDFRKAP